VVHLVEYIVVACAVHTKVNSSITQRPASQAKSRSVRRRNREEAVEKFQRGDRHDKGVGRDRTCL
jgi:hypothetical protein